MNADDVVVPLCGDRAGIHGHRRREYAPKLMIGMIAADLTTPRRGEEDGLVARAKRAFKGICQGSVFNLLCLKCIPIEMF